MIKKEYLADATIKDYLEHHDQVLGHFACLEATNEEVERKIHFYENLVREKDDRIANLEAHVMEREGTMVRLRESYLHAQADMEREANELLVKHDKERGELEAAQRERDAKILTLKGRLAGRDGPCETNLLPDHPRRQVDLVVDLSITPDGVYATSPEKGATLQLIPQGEPQDG